MEAQQAAAASDAPTAEDQAKLERETRKAQLIAEIVVIRARVDALEELVDSRRAALELLMSEDGTPKRVTPEGSASRQTRRSFVVHDRAKLRELFGDDVLLEHVKVGAEFYDAAVKAKVDIGAAVTLSVDSGLKVERRRTAAERERITRIKDETKVEMERRVESLARRMIEANRKQQERSR